MYSITVLLACTLFINSSHKSQAEINDNLNEVSKQQNVVKINKCCLKDEIKTVTGCRLAQNYNQTTWMPHLKDEAGNDINIEFVLGEPNCRTTESRSIYDLGNPTDKLDLLADGRLQHDNTMNTARVDTSDEFALFDTNPKTSHIYVQNTYCMDKLFMPNNVSGSYAEVCTPEVKIDWRDASFLLKNVLNPLFHGISMILYLTVAIIYFVLPTIRDLAGNIITTINMCLLVSQAADFVQIFTKYRNHFSFFYTDIALYIGLLGAFCWLNSFGFYIWKTFKSRNVFLRVTDVRKYCYYSVVVWMCVAVMTGLAIFAHFFLDTGPKHLVHDAEEQETVGWLGMAIFFTPIAFTIIINIFFYVTTLKVIRRINIYGRIHHKLKGCFDVFLQMFLIMTVAWLFLLLSRLNYDGLLYAHIVVNMLQSILIFYVCIVRQSHVTFLLRKSCCYNEPVPTNAWGDEEMTHMNGGY